MVRKPFQILNKCDDRYTFQINRVPTWIPDFILKNTMNALLSVFWVAFLPGQARHPM
jgi:hypothetical protein